MARLFKAEDRDKTIITPDGRRIGRVRDVDDDRAYVERDDDHDSLTDEIKDLLGWGDDDDEVYEVHNDHVDSYTDDEIRLRRRR